jgi:hypothetical protein
MVQPTAPSIDKLIASLSQISIGCGRESVKLSFL